MSVVRVKFGEYRNQPIIDKEFTLVKGFQTGKKGSFITVKNEGQFPHVAINEVRVKVENISDVEFTGTPVIEGTESSVREAKPVETDEEAMNRIATRFSILDEMAGACVRGDIRAMIVSGPPGVGKSFGVEQQLEKASMFDQLADRRARFNIVKGAMTALGLYIQLYKYSDRGNILVFDDCDSVFNDELALNLLKAALDSGKKRRICWNSDSRVLRDESIPSNFNFSGSVIFITNLKFENVRSRKLQDHLAALESRCHFIDLTIDTDRDKMLRIKQVHRDAEGGLFAKYRFSTEQCNEILNFMHDNSMRLREHSIRMALKIADLVKVSPSNWKVLAESTCMHRA